MPLFEYVCKKCGIVNEILVHAGEEVSPVCEKCGSKDLTKKISRVSVSCSSADGDFGGDMPSCDSCGEGSCNMDGRGGIPPCGGSCGMGH